MTLCRGSGRDLQREACQRRAGVEAPDEKTAKGPSSGPSFTFTPQYPFTYLATPTLALAEPPEAMAAKPADAAPKPPPLVYQPGFVPPKEADDGEAAWEKNWYLSDKLDAAPGAGKGATFGASTADGQTSVTSSVAAKYRIPSATLFGDAGRYWGWGAAVAAQWTKDNSTKTKVDGRMVRFSLDGNIPAPSSVHLLSSVNVDAVDDNVTKQRSVGLRGNVTPVVLNVFQRGSPYNTLPVIGYDIFATVGTQLDRVTYAKAPNSAGNAAGFNGRIDADFYPNGIFWHLHFFTTFVRARDVYASSGLEKRSATYYDFGVEWILTHPKNDGKSVTPALSLHRTIGENFLDGTSRAVKTMLVLTLKVN